MHSNRFLQSALLMPLSKLYGGVTQLRNALFNMNVFEQREFDIPVIVVGNLQVGGTGKTPHTEYILDALRTKFNIAMISRGYRRRTTGFVLADDNSTPQQIGDEAYQIYQKFGHDVRIAVCEDRCHGIECVRKIDPSIDMIVLDDAFQHRYVKPTIAIVLSEFNRPFYMDRMLPLGHLRESILGAERADMVVITKCPSEIKPIESRLLKKNLDLLPFQGLFFSRYSYGELEPLFPEKVSYIPRVHTMSANDAILVLTGIANPRPFISYLKEGLAEVIPMVYPDHHYFTKRDLDKVARRFNDIRATNKYILTTEKDAMRLIDNPHLPQELKDALFYVPVEVEFDRNFSGDFIESILKRLHEAKTTFGRR